MNAGQLRLSDVVGRKVRDPDGRVIGRLVEFSAEIVLHERGKDYVVHSAHVASHGIFAPFAGLRFVQELAARIGSAIGYKCFLIPWSALELADPRYPRLKQQVRDEWLVAHRQQPGDSP